MEINSFYLSLKLQLHLLYICYVAWKEVNCIFPQGQEGQIPKITNAACQHIEIQEQYMSSWSDSQSDSD